MTTRNKLAAVLLSAILLPPLTVSAQRPDAALPVRGVDQETFQLVSRFYDYDRTSPLNANVVAGQDRPAYVREKIVFSGMLGSRVPAYLALPKARTGRVPVV